MTSRMSEQLSSINQQTTGVGQDVKKGNPCALFGGSGDWCSYYGKQYGINSKEYMYYYVHCDVICNSEDLEAAQVPISR